MGYQERTDVGIRVEGWPVQFLPVASPLDEAALAEAQLVDLGGASALKDLARVEAFFGSGSGRFGETQGLA